MKKSNRITLSASIKIIIEGAGKGANKRNIRRPILIHRHNGLLYELQSVYVYRNHAKDSLNTQKTILKNLAFFIEWIAIKSSRNKKWLSPEQRAKRNQLALTRKEIDDFSRWSQLFAYEVAIARQKETKSIRRIPTGKTVEVPTTNSRLNTVCNYLVWLTEEFIEGSLNFDDEVLIKSEKYKKIITSSFDRNISGVKKAHPPLSLDDDESKILRQTINSYDIFPDTPCGTRDRLVTDLFYLTGLRAGELLKLRCEDFEYSYKINSRKNISIIKVIRRPNDPADERINEPAVKTLPGPVAISRKLANEIISYITNERRVAINHRKDNIENPYLFVCHSGPTIGQPISQRNLNRIMAKLKKIKELPQWISAHSLRHTHFTELSDTASKNKIKADDVIISNGHWSPNSKMPALYAQRHIMKEAANLVAKRDQILESKDND